MATRSKSSDPADRYAAAVGKAIQEIRQSKEISGADLARRAGISYTTLHHIERGRAADMKTLVAIAEALGVTVLDIIAKAQGASAPAVSTERREVEPPSAEHILAVLQGTAPEPPPTLARHEQAWAPRHNALTEEQRLWLDRLGWALLRAAETTNRAATQVLLEELAVSVGLAVDSTAGDDMRKAVNELRRKRNRV